MKNIFIATHSMEIGGAERSLLGMLHAIDYSNYNVDLFLYRHTGEFLDMIPEQVNLLPQLDSYASLAIPIIDTIRKKQYYVAGGRFMGKFMSYYYNKKNDALESVVGLEYSHKYTIKYLPKINANRPYELAISFLTPHYIVIEKVEAKIKVAWIHNDYSYVTVDIVSEKKMWDQFDYIISISKKCTESFIKKFPELKSKILLIENILSAKFVRQQAELSTDKWEMTADDTIKLLSVGRLSHQKNFENIPAICKKILAVGYKVKWFVIGYGSGEALIRSQIEEHGMQEHVIILGKKVNPYPYFKACDIYVQPSRYEGKAVTVREAQMLHKPVVITDFPTAQSQLTNGVDGLIVPSDNKGCAEGIIRLLKDPSLQNKLIENCKKSDFGNQAEIEKLYSLID